jgi:hypothetical protein
MNMDFIVDWTDEAAAYCSDENQLLAKSIVEMEEKIIILRDNLLEQKRYDPKYISSIEN